MTDNVAINDLVKAGVHFGHLTRKWNPQMARFIFEERNGIHIINLYKTSHKLSEARNALKNIAQSGRKILFVGTKKQAKSIVSKHATRVEMPYVTERWHGGLLTNFVTTRKTVRKIELLERMKAGGEYDTLSKKERLTHDRNKMKLEKNLGSIRSMTRLPAAIFVVDTVKEQIAISEAHKLGIPIFAMVDTNSDPGPIDYVIPSNDDGTKSIDIILKMVTQSISEGILNRRIEKDQQDSKGIFDQSILEAHKLNEQYLKNDKLKVPVALTNLSNEEIMRLPYTPSTQLNLINHNSTELRKDTTYQFEFKVKIDDPYKRAQLLKTFSYFVSASESDIDNSGLMLEFDENHNAIVLFNIIPRKKGKSILNVKLLQNFHLVNTLEVELSIE